jgi:hypothetical protein
LQLALLELLGKDRVDVRNDALILSWNHVFQKP